MKNILIIIALFACAIFVPVSGTQAAEFFFASESNKVVAGQIFEVNVFVNTLGEKINAIQCEIGYSPDLLDVKNINDGNSIISLWVEKPIVKDGKIFFSGIIPGGYTDARVPVLTIPFFAKNEGVVDFSFKTIKVLRHDGLGTEISATGLGMSLSIDKSSGAKAVSIPLKNDIEPPDKFVAEIVKDLNVFNGQWFLVFAAQDKGSGIDYYEVCEGKNECIIADSPHRLDYQELDRNIIVKAVDKSGNERISSITARNARLWYKDITVPAIMIMIVVVIGLLIVLKMVLWKYSDRSKF